MTWKIEERFFKMPINFSKLKSVQILQISIVFNKFNYLTNNIIELTSGEKLQQVSSSGLPQV